MKLYIYDHCPYCVRAVMVANYKAIQYNTIFLANDDEATCHTLIGAKMVPILQFDDGTAMGESLDIVKEFAERGEPEKIVLHAKEHTRNRLLLEEQHKTINTLLFPRDIALGLPEFNTDSAKTYFRKKKESALGMTFSQALEQTVSCSATIEETLHNLTDLEIRQELTMDDVFTYPTLRNLSMVKNLYFPEPVRNYVEHISALTGVETYFDRAI